MGESWRPLGAEASVNGERHPCIRREIGALPGLRGLEAPAARILSL
jgi:hypothetical protein